MPGEQLAGSEHVQRACSLCDRVSVGDRRRTVGVIDDVGVAEVSLHERERQDPHQRAVPVVLLTCPTRRLGSGALSHAAERRGRRAADVELPIAIGRVRPGIDPGEEPTGLVGRVEHGVTWPSLPKQRVKQGEHERPVVAPGAGWLVVRAVSAELDGRDLVRRLELVRHADGVPDQMAPDSPRETLSLLHAVPPGGRRRGPALPARAVP
jgi:hypothetical protein